MNNKKNEIIFLYFEKHLNIITISNELNVSKQYVSKIVRKDERHSEEALKRKKQNKEKQIERTKKCIQKKRMRDYENRLNAVVELQHIQATTELSGRKYINNRAFRNWNTSIYAFNCKTNEYQIKNEFKNRTSYAIPQKIKWN